MNASRYRALVVGTGSIGERHVRCLQRTGLVDVGICELQPALRDQVAQTYRLDAVFASVEDALRHRWDFAVVASPAPSHVSLAMKLAQAGVHLLIEKPLSLEAAQASPLLEEVQRRKLVAAVAYVVRAHPALRAMREALREGRFGQPVELVMVGGQHFPLYRPAYRQTYYTQHATGGGIIQDALTHQLNACEWLVGNIDRLVADAAHQVLDGVTVEDTVHVMARHGSVLASYTLNQHQSPNEVTITVVGEKGATRWELHHHRWRWMIEPGSEWHDEPTPLPDRDAWFVQQHLAYFDALEGRAPVLCTLEEGLQSVRVNQAALASVATKAWVELKTTP